MVESSVPMRHRHARYDRRLGWTGGHPAPLPPLFASSPTLFSLIIFLVVSEAVFPVRQAHIKAINDTNSFEGNIQLEILFQRLSPHIGPKVKANGCPTCSKSHLLPIDHSFLPCFGLSFGALHSSCDSYLSGALRGISDTLMKSPPSPADSQSTEYSRTESLNYVFIAYMIRGSRLNDHKVSAGHLPSISII